MKLPWIIAAIVAVIVAVNVWGFIPDPILPPVERPANCEQGD